MGLSGQQRKQLQEALINAFPTTASLEQMLAFELDKNLRAIAGEGSLQEIVFRLIQTADAQGWVEGLVDAARQSNPGNKALKDVAVGNYNERVKGDYSHSQKEPQFNLHSQKVNYTQLHNLLAAQKWLEADQETIQVMLKAANKSDSLSSGDLKGIPCEDLCIIDRLWRQHSLERFGLLPQARIYQEVREDYHNFCNRVGWKVGQRWKSYSELNWTLNAPLGHLPHMQGRKLYPTTEQNREFHLNSWALDLGDRAYGFLDSFGLMEGTLISALTEKLADCHLITDDGF